jgi:hypothetical protein
MRKPVVELGGEIKSLRTKAGKRFLLQLDNGSTLFWLTGHAFSVSKLLHPNRKVNRLDENSFVADSVQNVYDRKTRNKIYATKSIKITSVRPKVR